MFFKRFTIRNVYTGSCNHVSLIDHVKKLFACLCPILLHYKKNFISIQEPHLYILFNYQKYTLFEKNVVLKNNNRRLQPVDSCTTLQKIHEKERLKGIIKRLADRVYTRKTWPKNKPRNKI